MTAPRLPQDQTLTAYRLFHDLQLNTLEIALRFSNGDQVAALRMEPSIANSLAAFREELRKARVGMRKRHAINPGDRWNSLTAISSCGADGHGRAVWMFRCDCGREKARLVYTVVRGQSTKCGYCSAQENAAKRPKSTERDEAILAALSRGERVPSIAAQMGLTLNTVYGVKYRLSPAEGSVV